MKLFYLRSGLHLFAIPTKDDPERQYCPYCNGTEKEKCPEHSEPRVAFALLSLDAWGISVGLRVCRVYTGDFNIDDFFDRALIGININHGRIILDIAFIRVMLV